MQEYQVYNNDSEQPYPNFPQAMANLGLINSNAYSVWINDLSGSAGSILFGGVDTDKYTGPLRTIPIITQESSQANLSVSLTDIRLGNLVIMANQNITAAISFDNCIASCRTS